VSGPDRAEVTVVDGHDRRDVESLGERDDTGVGGAQGEVPISPHELGHARHVRVSEGWNLKRTGDETVEELGLDLRPDSAVEELADFGDDKRRDEERLPITTP